MSYVDEVTQEALRFGMRVNAITEISKAALAKVVLFPTLARYLKELSAGADDREFVDALAIYDSGDVNQYIKAIVQLQRVINTKYSATLQYMDRLTKNENVCDAIDNTILKNQISGFLGSTSVFVSDIERLGFEMPKSKAIPIDNNYCRTTNANANNYYNNNNSYTSFKNYVDRQYNQNGQNNSSHYKDIVNEIQVPLTFLMRVKDSGPIQLLKVWDDVVANSKTLGQFVTDMVTNESTINQKVPDDITAIREAMSDEAFLKLVLISRCQETAKKIAGIAATVLKSTPSSKANATSMDDLEKASVAMTDVADKIVYDVSANDAIKNMRDLHNRMVNVSKIISKFSRSAGISGRATGLSSSLWSSSSSIIRPFNMSPLNAESTPEVARMMMYCNMLSQHIVHMDADSLLTDVETYRANAIVILGELTKSVADPMCNRPQVRSSIVGTLKTFIKNVKRTLARYERKHTDFVMWSNRRALEYMIKWASVPVESQKSDGNPVVSVEVLNLITNYFKLMGDVATKVGEVMVSLEQAALVIFTTGDYISILSNEDEVLLEQMQSNVERFEKSIILTRAKLVRMYSPSGYSVLDVLKDPSVLMVYLLKVLRILLIWAALTFAKGIFLPLYNDAVYTQNKDPPHPIWFVALFIAFDMGLNLAVYVLLMTLQFVFKSMDNDFIINDRVLKMALIDYVLSTTLITVLALVISVVIRRKKYFRYRFEGDRGIRAMSDMLLWVSTGVLLIPFFRFLDA